MSTLKERIFLFLDSNEVSKSEFERKAGLSNGYLNNFKGNMGSSKLEDVLTAYPELSRDWLLYGEGEMLRGTMRGENISIGNSGNLTQTSTGADSSTRRDTTTTTTTNNYSGCTEADTLNLTKALDLIDEHRKLVAKSQEQIDKLLDIISRKV